MTPVFIDIDGTLIDGPDVESMFFDYMTRRRMIKREHYLAYFWFMVRWLFKYGTAVGRWNKAYLGGMRRADVDVYSDSFAKKVMLELVRPEMWDAIDMHKERGDKIVLLAEAPDFLLKSLARRLDVPYWRGTIFAYLGNKYLADPPPLMVEGKTKLEQAQMIAGKLGTTLEQCWAYSSSQSDLPLMKAVGHPVAVFPDRKLQRVAKKQDWKIIR